MVCTHFSNKNNENPISDYFIAYIITNVQFRRNCIKAAIIKKNLFHNKNNKALASKTVVLKIYRNEKIDYDKSIANLIILSLFY